MNVHNRVLTNHRYLTTEAEVSRADMTKFEEVLTNLGVDVTPVQYVKG